MLKEGVHKEIPNRERGVSGDVCTIDIPHHRTLNCGGAETVHEMIQTGYAEITD